MGKILSVLKEFRCKVCGKLLFKGMLKVGSTVSIKCKCKSVSNYVA